MADTLTLSWPAATMIASVIIGVVLFERRLARIEAQIEMLLQRFGVSMEGTEQ